MIEQFIPYTQALTLKKLGFDEKCLGLYRHNELFLTGNGSDINSEKSSVISAPLWQQAFDWFRNVHGLSAEVYYYSDTEFNKWHFDIEPLCPNGKRYTTPMQEAFETYEQARLECLIKLMEYHEK